MFVVGYSMIEMILTYKRFQCEIGLYRSSWRTNGNYFSAFERSCYFVKHFRAIHNFTVKKRLLDSCFCINKLISKSSAIANEISIYFTVISVGYHAKFSIALASNNIA